MEGGCLQQCIHSEHPLLVQRLLTFDRSVAAHSDAPDYWPSIVRQDVFGKLEQQESGRLRSVAFPQGC
jgi:hypothetical protein